MNIKVLSRLQAERVLYTPESFCISIFSSGCEAANIIMAKPEDVLNIQFDDIDQTIGYRDVILFDSDHAKQIVNFLMNHLKFKYMAVHCDAGISRSPAVAIAIDEFLNGNSSALYEKYHYYNRHVYHTLRSVLYATMV